MPMERFMSKMKHSISFDFYNLATTVKTKFQEQIKLQRKSKDRVNKRLLAIKALCCVVEKRAPGQKRNFRKAEPQMPYADIRLGELSLQISWGVLFNKYSCISCLVLRQNHCEEGRIDLAPSVSVPSVMGRCKRRSTAAVSLHAVRKQPWSAFSCSSFQP